MRINSDNLKRATPQQLGEAYTGGTLEVPLQAIAVQGIAAMVQAIIDGIGSRRALRDRVTALESVVKLQGHMIERIASVTF